MVTVANHAEMMVSVAVNVPKTTVKWEFLQHPAAVASIPSTMSNETPNRTRCR